MTRVTINKAMPSVPAVQNLDRVIRDWFGISPFEGLVSREEFAPVSFPRVDVKENDSLITIVAEIPGMKKDDIKVLIEENFLTISGERKYEHEEKQEGFLRREISRGSFTRSFTLPESAATERMEATYKDGFLSLTIPKKEEAKPKQIEVKVK